jgi:hypothetical protein
MDMESNLNVPDWLNVPDSLNDDIHPDSLPYFLDPSPVPASTVLIYVANPGALPGSERMQGSLGGAFEKITSYPDPTARLPAQELIGSVEPYRSGAFVAGIWNGLTDGQLDMPTELERPFNMDPTGTQDPLLGFDAHDNLNDPPSVLSPHTSSSDELTQSALHESPPTVGVQNKKAIRRERHPKTNGGYPCDQCTKKFDIHRDLTYVAAEKPTMALAYDSRRHKQQHSRSYTCHHCRGTFATQKDLNRHVGPVHDGHRSHICPVCSKGFGRRDNMHRHCRNLHQNDISPGDDV